MKLFKRRGSANDRATGDSYSILHASLTVYGDIETDGTVRVDGRLEGSIRRAGMVILGPASSVEGNVAAREVIIGGTVQGNIEAKDRVELQPSAIVTGDIDAGAILMHEGGTVRGRLNVRSQMAEVARPRSATPRAVRLATASGDAS
jgi:cytoskeletal protein CcmA (bactofilin family)